MPDFVTKSRDLRWSGLITESNRAMDNTILIVEDDPQLQEVLALTLQNAGYRVLKAVIPLRNVIWSDS